MTFKHRLKKCMAVIDVDDYRLEMTVVVDCYKMKNVQIKGTEPLTNCVKYLPFMMALCRVFYYWTMN
jgi:hypothetical protein